MNQSTSHPIKSVCVFCGASMGNNPQYAIAAKQLGVLLASQGITLVYGGGKVGLMGVVAEAALSAGGKVIGVIPKALATRELRFDQVTELHVVGSMHERKALMAKFSDAFVALPGGIGTLEEFFEIWTWAQLGFHQKPIALYNVSDYYSSLIAFLDNAVVRDGFVQPRSRQIIGTANSAEEVLLLLQSYQPSEVRRWIESENL